MHTKKPYKKNHTMWKKYHSGCEAGWLINRMSIINLYNPKCGLGESEPRRK
jgi:hypothetical protein